MHGEQLVSKLAYGIHAITSNQLPQNLVFGYLSPCPRGQSATRPGCTAELQNTGRGAGPKRTSSRTFNKDAFKVVDRASNFARILVNLFNIRRSDFRSETSSGS